MISGKKPKQQPPLLSSETNAEKHYTAIIKW